MTPNAESWNHGLQIGAKTHVGMVRGNNQDNLAVIPAASHKEWTERGHLFVVADGMGAHAAGELASKIAVDQIPLAYRKRNDLPPHEALKEAIESGHSAIYERGQGAEEFRGMGTTVSALVLLPWAAFVGHVGDSRVYRLRGGRFEQLTFDHSLFWEFRAAGQIDDEEVASYVPRNIITRSLGPKEDVDVDLEGPFPLEPGDTFLLCSDGLSGCISDEELGVLIETLPPEEAAEVLVDMANLRGGRDNITVIVTKISDPSAAEPGDLRVPAAPGRHRRAVSWVYWGMVGASLLLGLGGFAVGLWPVGLSGLLVAAVLSVLTLFRATGSTKAPAAQLGKAPYVRLDDLPYRTVLQKVADMFRDLRDAATRQDWPVDWYKFKQYENRIQASSDSMPKEAVSAYARAIHFLMSQLSQSEEEK